MANDRLRSMPSTWMIAAGVFAVVMILLLLFGYGFLGAILLSLVLAAAVAAFFLVMQRRPEAAASRGYRTESAGDAPRAAAARSETPTSATASETSQEPRPEPAPVMSTSPAAEAEGEPAKAAASPAATTDGQEPPRLEAPREGGADDLKKIKGVGPKLESALHAMGIYHIDQIAAWNEAEVAWMDENLVEFRGRVSRDDWVGQARHLASGGDTEFSRRVEDGDVYQ